MQISQIYISDAGYQLPDPLKETTSTIDKYFPDVPHVIYNKETLRQFIADNYEVDVLWAFDKLAPYSYKADLGRFCLLNHFGGWYFDITVRAAFHFMPYGSTEFFGFRDIQRFSQTSYACATTVMYSKPNNAILQTAIKYIVRNCREEYYGITALCPTGPTLLGEALAAHRSNANHTYGDFLELTPGFEQKNKAFVLPDGTIFAWHKNGNGGDLVPYGVFGSNNYNQMWHERQIYMQIDELNWNKQ